MKTVGNFILILLVLVTSILAKPMESVEKINIILVHGAADAQSGMDCSGEVFFDAVGTGINTTTGYSNRIGGFPDNWFWENNTGATGLIKELVPWLSESIFEGDKSTVYLQRPLTNPAASPFDNKQEIGDPTWPMKTSHYSDNCKVRRSLIEEAKEVRSGGRRALFDERKQTKMYRNRPNRNIIISHSMGGVTSREYVQGRDYNGDVDKIVTLDSPHEGTEALNLLLDMGSGKTAVVESFTQWVTLALVTSAWGNTWLEDHFSCLAWWMIGVNVGSDLVKGMVGVSLGYNYERSDGLVTYIDPNYESFSSSFQGVKQLRDREYTNTQPMFRLLYGTNALTFTDPNASARLPLSFVLPDALTGSIGNVFAQYRADKNYYPYVITGAMLGSIGITTQDHGTSLIPESSGKASKTKSLNHPMADIKRVPYDGAINTYSYGVYENSLLSIFGALGATWFLDVFSPDIKMASRIALGISGAIVLSGYSAIVVAPVVSDFDASHRAPSLAKYQSQWKGTPNTYSTLILSLIHI